MLYVVRWKCVDGRNEEYIFRRFEDIERSLRMTYGKKEVPIIKRREDNDYAIMLGYKVLGEIAHIDDSKALDGPTHF